MAGICVASPACPARLLLWAGLDVRLGETAVRAQDFPKRAITLVVPRPAGGMSERLAELLAPPLSRAFGVPVNIRLMPATWGARAPATWLPPRRTATR